MRHRLVAPPLAALAVLALASVALAGGWAQVIVTDAPVDPPAGEETTVELGVFQHGVTPVSWPGLTVIATDAKSGTVVRAEAVAKGPEGSYVATIVFPTAGEWTLTFDSTELVMGGSGSLTIAPAVNAVQPGAATSTAQAFDVMPLVLVLLAAVVALIITGQVLHSRGASGDTRVSART